MRAMILEEIAPLSERPEPLRLLEREDPEPGEGEVLLAVRACGVCHTELDEIEGRTPPPELPVIPGHQVVGEVAGRGPGAERFREGDRIGVAWIYSACGECERCREGEENLCPDFRATGRDADGGYAGKMTVPEAYAYPIPGGLGDSEAAPLLCAGAIGYRSLRLTGVGNGDSLGLTGFGGSAHLVLQLVGHLFPDTRVHVFARDPDERDLARRLGAVWAGDIADEAPRPLDAIIDTTPAWRPVVEAMKSLRPGGRLVINAIRKEDGDKEALLDLDYGRDLWLEREIRSVANVTRRDVGELLEHAAELGIRPTVTEYALEEANRALRDLREKSVRGSNVLVTS